MSTDPLAIRNFARRLIALEAARDESHDAPADSAARVCDRLCVPLARLVGVAGFRSLMSRALTMAKSEVPSLTAAVVRADGSLEGLNRTGQDRNGAGDGEAGLVIVAQLLGLLVTFIGEPLTLQLVRDVWRELPATGMDAGNGEGL